MTQDKAVKEMTREEFLNDYGDVKVRFSSYYKFTFGYSASLPNGNLLSVSCGGTADGIYRWDVTADGEMTAREVDPYCGCVIRDGEVVCSFYGY